MHSEVLVLVSPESSLIIRHRDFYNFRLDSLKMESGKEGVIACLQGVGCWAFFFVQYVTTAPYGTGFMVSILLAILREQLKVETNTGTTNRCRRQSQ